MYISAWVSARTLVLSIMERIIVCLMRIYSRDGMENIAIKIFFLILDLALTTARRMSEKNIP